MQLAERDILKIVLLKKAKDTVAPKPENIATEVPEEEITPKKPAPQSEKEEQPAEPIRGIMGDGALGNIIFACQGCGGMLSSSLDNAGMVAQCPLCKTETTIPSKESASESEAGTSDETVEDSPQETPKEEFIIFVCQTCGQEIEAPVDMVKMNATCPTCGSSINIPEESQALEEPSGIEEQEGATEGETHGPGWKSRTMRIDLSDLD